ncbi:unnamed protein product [Prorocentrum cordatum]|uniref:Uncharacterized protein n=1 Tax=Prorocentrum cordatum TaxID=2364126 RepID=A0ABN9SE53_9DINO|nr:unnamed protein product [Polarella glacialis]
MPEQEQHVDTGCIVIVSSSYCEELKRSHQGHIVIFSATGGGTAQPAVSAAKHQGIYVLESAQSPNGYPVWKHEGKDWWLYNSPNDFWGIGGEACKIENFKCNKGRIVATKVASGLMPWDMREWRYSDGAQWYVDNSIKMDVLQDMSCQDASLPVGFVPAKEGGAACAVRFPAGRDVAEIQMKLLLGELARRAEWRIGVPASDSKGGALARRLAMRIHVTPVDRRLLSS